MKSAFTWIYLAISFLAIPFFGIAQETLIDGIDNDNDGFVDCFDPDLYGAPGCGTFYFGQPIPECREKPPVLNSYNLVEKYRTNQNLHPIDQRCGVFVGDVGNSDPFPELIAIGSSKSAHDRLYIFSGVDGSLVQYFNLPTVFNAYAQTAVGDVDRDGYADIFVNLNKYVYRYEYSSSPSSGNDTVGNAGLASTNNSLYSSASSPQLADFNSDGIPEVYIENNIYNAQTLELIVDGGSTNTGKTDGDNTSNGDAWPIAYDVFKPGDIIPNSGGQVFDSAALGLELIAGGQVMLVDFRDSTMSVALTASLTGVRNNGDGFTSIADLNRDERIDIIVTSINSSNNACVYAWDPYTGNQIGTTFELGDGPNGTSKHGGRCNVADFDNDGEVEIGTAGKSLYVVLEYNAVDNTLVEKWSKRTGILDTSERTGSTLFDFEGDGSAEVVYSEENNLYIWKGSDGSEMANIPSPSGTRTDYPLVADADGDGQAEIVITGQSTPGPSNSGPGYVAVYRSSDAPWVSARESWNQHGYHVTNLGLDMTIPADQQLIVDPAYDSAFNATFNGFLVQTTFLTEFADPTFAVGDLTTENVIVDLDQCVAQDSITFTVTLENNGDWKAPRYTPLAIFDGDPYAENATYLGTIYTKENVEKGGALDITHTVYDNDGDGTMDLYVLVNHYEETLNIGDNLPAPLTGVTSPTMECDYVNNVGFIVSINTCNVSNAPRLDLDRDNSGGVAGNGFKKAFGVGSATGAIIVDDDVFIIDDDNTEMASATITLTNRLDGTKEYLQHPSAGSTVNGVSISTYNSSTGIIILSGTADLSVYEDILNGVTYYNTLDNATISGANRIIEIQVSDGTNNSNIAVDSVLIEYKPELDLDFDNSSGAPGTSYQAAYVENGAAVKIVDSDVYIETNGLDIQSVTIQHTNIKDGANEGLAVVGSLPAGISISTEYEYSVGTLVLSGAASPADYQTALQRILYSNTSDAPNTTPRIFTVKATDIYLESLEATSTISVTEVNDPPIISGPSDSLFYNEGQATTNIVEYDFIVDIDDTEIESAEISISAGLDNTEDVLAFTNQNGISGSFNSTTGILTLTGSATLAEYQAAIASITYENTDGSDASESQRTISITVNDGDANSNIYTRNIYVNVAPEITSSTTISVDDGVSAIQTVTANDANSGDTKTFSKNGGADAGSFTINSSTGALTLTGGAVFANTPYVVNIMVTDQGGLTDVKTITVNVNDPANPSPDIRDASTFIDEDITNSTTVFNVDDFSGGDTDSGAENLEYSITAGNHDGIFDIDANTGIITVLDNSKIDFETTEVYYLTITATDNHNPTAALDNAVITINVNNLNDNDPVIANATVSISEDAANNTEVHDVNESNTGNDSDLDGEALSYTIESGNAGNVFGIDGATGEIEVTDNSNLDYETLKQYLLTIRASDGVKTVDSVITVNVTGINDNNPLISNATVSISESAANTSAVHDVDDDNTSGDTDIDEESLTYSLVGGNTDGIFTIDPATGEITVFDNTNLDFETTTQYVLTIRADDGANTDDADITVNISDNDSEVADFILDPISDVLINENTAYASVTPNITANPDMPIGGVTYTLSGVDALDFTIDAGTGDVSMIGRDFENPVDSDPDNDYEVTITATDDDGNTASVSWTVTIQNVNEVASFDIDPISDVTIDENQAYTSVIPSITGTPNGTLTYTLGGNDAARFTIDAETGVVRMIGRDYENPVDNDTDNEYEVTITATDGDSNNDDESWTVTILPVDEASPIAHDDNASVAVDGTLSSSVSDNDEGLADTTITFTLIADVTNGSLTLNTDGTYTYTPNAGYSGTDSFVYEVCDTDGDCDQATATISVSSTFVNSAPVAVNDNVTITEGGTATGNVLTNDSDPDNGDELTVSTTPLTPPTNGTVTINRDGSYTYSPDNGFTGTDFFIYEVCDNGTPQECASATVTITVTSNDTDGDGIPNEEEGKDDPDGDGIPSDEDNDSDGDGIPDAEEGTDDTDGDSTPDYKDEDSDDDGIRDEDEGNNDTDGDGNEDFRDTDSDDDTIPDAMEGNEDADGDGTPNYQDLDSDDDGISDEEEATGDCDNDGISNALDSDRCREGDIFIPEGFSPNGDGDNDYFVIPEIAQYNQVSIEIYNRWGNKIYEQANYENDWDGTSNVNLSLGSELPTGTYFYIVNIHDTDETLNGYVYINR